MNKQGYDLIGDIHGHADELEALLQHMGYRHVDGCYRHPERVVIFLGDFIDRGPKQRDVLRIVMPMVRDGGSLAVMGTMNSMRWHSILRTLQWKISGCDREQIRMLGSMWHFLLNT